MTAPRGTPDTLTEEPASSRGPPSLRLTLPGQGTRPPGARRKGRARGPARSGPGRQRGQRSSYPCRPRARRLLWSRQSSRSAAPASVEFRAVKYLLKAAMDPPVRASREWSRGGVDNP